MAAELKVTIYSATCLACYHSVFQGEDYIGPYMAHIESVVACPECESINGWHVQARQQYVEDQFEVEFGRFETLLTAWLVSPEGKKAQERASWGI